MLVDYLFEGTAIPEHSIVATGEAQKFSHDNMFDLAIRTAASGGGLLLVEDTDYTLSAYDPRYRGYNLITFAAGYIGQTLYINASKSRGDYMNSSNINAAIIEGGGGTMAANSIKGNPTGEAAVPVDISIAANKFPARASTGNLEAKSITDFGLGLVAAADAAAGRTALGALGSANITQTISNGVTDKAPSEDAVYDALALKAPLESPTFTGMPQATNPLFKTHYANATPIPYNLLNGQFSAAGFIVPVLNNYLYMAHIRHTVVLTNFTNPAPANLFNGSYGEYSSNQVPVRVGDTDGVSTVSITFPGTIGALYGYGVVYLWFYYESTRPMPSAVRARVKYGGNWSNYVNGTNYQPLYGICCYAVPFSGYYHSTTELEIEITNSSETALCSLSEIEYCKYNDYTFTPLMSKGAQNEIFGNQLFYNTSNALTAGIYPATGEGFFSILKTPLIKPVADSTTAIQLTKSNGTTSVMTVDTTNSRIGINKTPTEPLDVAGNIKSSGYLELSEISEPDAGAADTARLYAVDVSGVTKLAFKDSSGTATILGEGSSISSDFGAL